jgi:hypothetical protein
VVNGDSAAIRARRERFVVLAASRGTGSDWFDEAETASLTRKERSSGQLHA